MSMMPVQGIISGAQAAAGSTLLTDLVSWWSTDETSGTRVDSHGSNDLTDNNTVGSVIGKVSNAAVFSVSRQEWLSDANQTTLHGGARDYTMAAWISPVSTPTFGGVFTCNSGAGNVPAGFDYMLCLPNGSGPNAYMAFYIAVGSTWKLVTDTTTDMDNSTWYYVIASHEASTKTLRISINAGTESSTVYTGTPNDLGSQVFGMGVYAQSNGGQYNWNGWVDEACFYNRLLSSDERSELYNSGSGIGYPG